MHKCPTCDGSGQMKFSLFENSKAPVPRVMTCIDCNGRGQITEEKLAHLQYIKTIWCSCDPHPDLNITFHPDGNEVCAKHCYTCNKCGKIVQIG
jgi:hypothetical protein